MHTGKFLQHITKEKGFNQEELALKLDYSQSKISRIMNDDNPKTEYLLDILELIGVSKKDFDKQLKDFDPPKSNKPSNKDLELIQAKFEHLREKEQWLIEKEKLVDEKKELQDEIIRLREKYGERK